MDLEIEKNLVVSTSHMSVDDYNKLTDIMEYGGSNMIVYQSDYWTLVYLATIKDADFTGFSESFKKLCLWANDIGEFTFLKFDSDGLILDGFEIFDW